MLYAIALVGASGCTEQSPEIRLVSQAEVVAHLEQDAGLFLLDVRTQQEFDAGHLPGATLIPHDQLAGRLAELTAYQNREVVVYCEVGVRAAAAEDLLLRSGFSRVAHLEGDMAAWRKKGLPTAK